MAAWLGGGLGGMCRPTQVASYDQDTPHDVHCSFASGGLSDEPPLRYTSSGKNDFESLTLAVLEHIYPLHEAPKIKYGFPRR